MAREDIVEFEELLRGDETLQARLKAATGAYEGDASTGAASRGHYYVGNLSQSLTRKLRRDEPMTQEEAVRALLLLGQVSMNNADYESATEAYASILKLEPNAVAFYNLGSLRARGLGGRRDFVEGARLFHQAELLGNERAGVLCGKCMFDYLCEGIDQKRPADLYAAMAVFVTRVYPEATDQGAEVNSGLLAVANTLVNKEAYAEAAKLFQAAAEFGHDEYAQSCLDVLRNGGVDQ